MRTLRNYLLALTLVVSAISFAACGNDMEEPTSVIETTTVTNTTTGGGNSGNVNDTTKEDGVIGDLGNAVEDVGDAVKDGTDDIENGVRDIAN